MAFIALKWFGGMVPRRGRQHLPAPHATEAENCNLMSGELRPLKQPAAAHVFCTPIDDCWRAPFPDDPSIDPEPPPEPPQCIPVVITSQPAPTVAPAFIVGETVILQLTVNADATAPIQIQWYRDGIAIPGAVEPLYTHVLTLDDEYVPFSATVQNPCGFVETQTWTPGAITPIIPPECLPYDCAAYEDYLISIGINPDYFWTADAGNFPFPGCSFQGEVDKLHCWFNYIAGGTAQTSWGTSSGLYKANLSNTNFLAWAGDPLAGLPDYCAGGVVQATNIAKGSTPTFAVTNFGSNATGGQNSGDWGDYIMSTTFCGLNGSATMGGWFAWQSGKSYDYVATVPGFSSNNYKANVEIRFGIFADGGGGWDFRFYKNVGTRGTSPGIIDTLTSLPVGFGPQQWSRIIIRMASTAPYLVTNADDVDVTPGLTSWNIDVSYDVELINADTGEVYYSDSDTFTHRHAQDYSVIGAFTPRYSRTLYEGPVFFRDVSPGYCLADLQIEINDDYFNFDITDLSVALDRTYNDYIPPGYCP